MVGLDSLKKLAVQIALGGGLVTFVMINTVPYITDKKMKETAVYQEAMTMIKNHPEAIKYLGEPIIDGKIQVTNKEMYGSDEEKGWFSVPIKGPKSVGNVYCESRFEKDNEKVKVQLSKVELSIKSVPGFKLMIKRAAE